MELYFVVDIYQADHLTLTNKIVHNNLQLKMIETNRDPPNKYSLLQMHMANKLKSISIIQEMNNLNCQRKS